MPGKDQGKKGKQNLVKGKTFPIVGIGASAGGLEALETFFASMPPDPGIAFVVIQHLSPKHKSILGQILQRDTRMKVVEINDGMQVEPNTVFFNPPDKEVGLFHGAFQLVDPAEGRGIRMPIDFFFRSLAEDMGEKAICIILSGTGSDGTLGLEEVKGLGGMTMAQPEQQAKYPFMPKSAIDTGQVDYVLPVEKMPEELIRYVKHPYLDGPEKAAAPAKKFQDFVQKILMLIRATTKHDFTHYKQTTVRRRIERRMAVHKIDRIENYYRYLQENPAEVRYLFKDMVICVTSFFRDLGAFDVLEKRVFPAILEGKSTGSSVRIWVPGCATGEETISLAILLTEAMERTGKFLPVQIFATDIDADAVERARQAEYPESIAADITPERLKRFFLKTDSKYRAKPEIREMAVFAVQNFLADPPFSRLDLVSCRNVLIYLDAEIQQKVLPMFHFTLNPGGYLFLGASETIGGFSDLFAPVDVKWKIYQRKGVLTPRILQYTVAAALPAPAPELQGMPRAAARQANIRELIEKIILDDYAPACVLVNNKFDILYFHGHTGKFLSPPVGEPSFNLLKMAPESLRPKLATALHLAEKEKKAIVYPDLTVTKGDSLSLINLIVRPLTATREDIHLFMVVFEEKAPPKPRKKKALPPAGEETDLRLADLERELQFTREYLQTTIEELEASNEEQQSANEELQSTNEELQSTNEELETAKEELQSTNEELLTVNSELQEKVEELSQVNDDINNLLASTEIGTLFLDRRLVIKRFTPSMTKLVNLIPGDVGRSLKDITSRFPAGQIWRQAESVLADLQVLEQEVQTENGKWFSMRIMPYRTRENIIAGVVITFADISAQKQAQMEIQIEKKFAQGIVNTVREPLLVMDRDLRVLFANPAFYKTFRTIPERVEGENIYRLCQGQLDQPGLRQLLEEIIPQKTVLEDFECDCELPEVGKRKLLINARRLVEDENREMILLAMEEVTDRGAVEVSD